MNATGPSGELAPGQPMIRLEGVGKQYADGTVAVHALDLEVMPGEVVVLVGPSGCGKSTTLKMINRLIEPTSGRIFLEGSDVTDADPVQLRRRIGYVIQQIGLFPHQKIATNVATVPSLIGTPKAEAKQRARELLALVGLDPDVYADRYPHQLSGGQQQRVGVARALAAARPPRGTPTAPPPCSPAGCGAGWGSVPRWPPTRPCSAWTSRSPPWTRWSAPGCRTSSCASRTSWTRPSSWSPTTSTRR